jgi:hypothetical protein
LENHHSLVHAHTPSVATPSLDTGAHLISVHRGV